MKTQNLLSLFVLATISTIAFAVHGPTDVARANERDVINSLCGDGAGRDAPGSAVRPGFKAPRGSVAVMPQDQDDLAVSLSQAAFHVLHGDYSESAHGSFIRYRPSGEGPHSLELVWQEGGQPEFWVLPANSECFVSLEAIVADLKGQGRIEWLSNIQVGQGLCDGSYTGIRAVTTSGGCWAPPKTDINSGVITWTCSLNNNKSCDAKIISSDSSVDPVTPSWECGSLMSAKFTFDPVNRIAGVLGAQSGC